MKIAFASDHGGYELKEALTLYAKDKGIEVLDLGTKSEDSVDYPDYGEKCGNAVVNGDAELGVVVCGTGIGISIAANKVKGVRAALCTSVEMAKLSKQHNNANVLALGGRILTLEQGKEIFDAWLNEEFEGGRHERRTNKLDTMC